MLLRLDVKRHVKDRIAAHKKTCQVKPGVMKIHVFERLPV
jgi:hypothetical protein